MARVLSFASIVLFALTPVAEGLRPAQRVAAAAASPAEDPKEPLDIFSSQEEFDEVIAAEDGDLESGTEHTRSTRSIAGSEAMDPDDSMDRDDFVKDASSGDEQELPEPEDDDVPVELGEQEAALDDQEGENIVPEEQRRIVLEGFPDDDKNATTRTLFNGEYVESVALCVNGKPTYNNDKDAAIYFCKANHRWHITTKKDLEEKFPTKEDFEAECPNFVAFKERMPLAVAKDDEKQVEYVWVGGVKEDLPMRRAWEKDSKHIPAGEYQEKDAWVSNIRITHITGNDEGVCQ